MKLDIKDIKLQFYWILWKIQWYKFYNPNTKLIFELGHAPVFWGCWVYRGDTVREFVFEKEYVDIPMDDIGIDQGFIPSFAQNIIDQDNIGSLHTRNCSRGINCTTSKIYVIKKIHRKTEKCNANDYIVFLQDNEVDIKVMEDDRINFYGGI